MKVGYQGCPGAYSEMAARAACPDGEPTPCEQFEVCLGALQAGHWAMVHACSSRGSHMTLLLAAACLQLCGYAWEWVPGL